MIGLGSPTENPFFADIYIPSTVPLPLPSSSSTPGPNQGKKVHVFIHGGFLNFGSTSGQHYNQQFFAAETFDEIRVLLGYRVSAWGFLGSEKGGVSGNYGFKDCWAGLEWVKENISAFGGEQTLLGYTEWCMGSGGGIDGFRRSWKNTIERTKRWSSCRASAPTLRSKTSSQKGQ